MLPLHSSSPPVHHANIDQAAQALLAFEQAPEGPGMTDTNRRYPDPAIRILDPRFKALRLASASVECPYALPERCANVCFGGRHRNRLFMAASHGLYSLYVNTQGVKGELVWLRGWGALSRTLGVSIDELCSRDAGWGECCDQEKDA